MYTVQALIIVGLAQYLFLPTDNGRTSGLAIILQGLSILFLDLFPQDRAQHYQSQIITLLERA